jgi:hypothetical protein
MKSMLCASGLLLGGLFCADQALAAASATVDVKGRGVTSVSTSGVNFVSHGESVFLPPGGSAETWWRYSMSVDDDGKPATRTWFECEPTPDGYCGPEPTGFEQAYASLNLYLLDVAPWMEVTILGDTPSALATRGDALPEDRKVKGRFGIRWVNTNPDDNAWADFGVSAAVFVDARPVPRKSLND